MADSLLAYHEEMERFLLMIIYPLFLVLRMDLYTLSLNRITEVRCVCGNPDLAVKLC